MRVSTLCSGFRSSLSATLSTPGRSLRRGFGFSTRPLRSRSTSPTLKKTLLLSTIYPPSLWNINSAVEYDEPRTNKASEEGNNAINAAFSSTHPSIWVFIETLSKLHSETELKHIQMVAGVNQQRGPRSSGGCGKISSSGSSRTMTLTPRWTSAVVSATTITDSDNHGKFIYKFLEHLFSSL